MSMNRRGFFALLGKLAAVAASAKVLPFKLPPQRDTVTFDRGPQTVMWYGPTSCNWSFSKNWEDAKGGKAEAVWTDPKNWSGA